MPHRIAKTAYYPELAVGGFAHSDRSIAFYLQVNSLLRPGFTVLDVGCGRGEYAEDQVPIRRHLRILKGRCTKVIGIDADLEASANPFVDEFRLIETADWPVSDTSVDLCVVDHVLEHVAEPERFIAECARVTRSGGYLCIRTPNAFGYPTLAARIIPERLHLAILKHAQPDRQTRDVFPAYYRCNTRGRLREVLAANGYKPCVYLHEGEPAYFEFSRSLYAAGALWARIAPSALRGTIFAFAQRD